MTLRGAGRSERIALGMNAVAAEEQREIRFAVVMTGGVSLAVWMGGVAHELNRVVRDRGSRYRKLLEWTASRARVDVISGTSAGGLNGAVLALAQVQHADLASLRDVWLREGELERLLRSPGEPDPPSLLRGDDYFLTGIKNALDGIVNLSGNQLPDVDAVPVRLMLTATLLDGQHRGIPDDFGSVIYDRDDRGQFTFQRGGTLEHHPEDCPHWLARERRDDWAGAADARAHRAGRAARRVPAPVGRGRGGRRVGVVVVVGE